MNNVGELIKQCSALMKAVQEGWWSREPIGLTLAALAEHVENLRALTVDVWEVSYISYDARERWKDSLAEDPSDRFDYGETHKVFLMPLEDPLSEILKVLPEADGDPEVKAGLKFTEDNQLLENETEHFKITLLTLGVE